MISRSFGKHNLFAALILAAGLFGTFAVARADGVWLPENYSTIGEEIDHLYRVIFRLTTVLLILTEGALIYFVIRYRRRAGRRASNIHESATAETIWSVIPGLILVFLAFYQWNAWANARIRFPAPEESVRIEVIARQFEWHIRYPGPDDRFATDDDITMTNQMFIPRDKPVLLQLRADDVIHSFYLPNFRVKQDIVPGTTVQMWFDALKTGRFEIACAELCGLGHYRMRGLLTVHTPEEFESWLQGKYEANVPPADWGWDWEEGT